MPAAAPPILCIKVWRIFWSNAHAIHSTLLRRRRLRRLPVPACVPAPPIEPCACLLQPHSQQRPPSGISPHSSIHVCGGSGWAVDSASRGTPGLGSSRLLSNRVVAAALGAPVEVRCWWTVAVQAVEKWRFPFGGYLKTRTPSACCPVCGSVRRSAHTKFSLAPLTATAGPELARHM